MMERLSSWFVNLSVREKLLVSVAGLLVSGLIAVYGLYMPLTSSIQAKHQEYRAALERRVAVEEAVTDASNARTEAAPAATTGPLELGISQSASEAGFTLDRAEAAGNGRVAIAMAQARPSALLKWLAEQELQGIVAEKIDIKAGANGTVSIDATMARSMR
jgi:general secretion pathway protein M